MYRAWQTDNDETNKSHQSLTFTVRAPFYFMFDWWESQRKRAKKRKIAINEEWTKTEESKLQQ